MKKSERISNFVKALATGRPASDGIDPRYSGFFICFNRGDYYEAHDVLENLWLETRNADYAFYKGLIQIAGAFVHLRKQYERPAHPKDGRRLRPASRLFLLGMNNLSSFAPRHHWLDVRDLIRVSEEYRAAICKSDYAINPWQPGKGPFLTLNAISK